MLERYLSLLIMLMAAWCVGTFLSHSTETIHASYVTKPCQVHDPESLLACNRKIDLNRATVFDLELIDGVSDVLAFRIYGSRSRILARARELEATSRYKAFEIVHGIGAKTARKLATFLDLG